jgi:pimeloyl-ACP methyl ester carboxylesterase
MAIDADLSATGFSIRTACYLARACQAWQPSQWAPAMDELGISGVVQPFAFENHDGFVAVDDAKILVVFRGTNDAFDWLTNAQIAQVADDAYPGRVHAGFREAMAGLWPELAPLLPPPAAGLPVLVAGHSMGGALATLAAHRLQNAEYDVHAVHTFGSPRVGDIDFYVGYWPVLFRFVNNNDVVPHVPLETQLGGSLFSGFSVVRYKHVGTLKYFDRHGMLGDGASDWIAKKALVLDTLTRLGESMELYAITDHAIDQYVAAVRANLA